MDVIWTISFKITAEIEIRKHMFCLTSQTSCIGSVGQMFFYCHEMRLHCFFTVNSRPVVFLKYIFEFVFNTDRSRGEAGGRGEGGNRDSSSWEKT